jgi:hypothetical protein
MSEHDGAAVALNDCKSKGLQSGSPMARAVHGLSLLVRAGCLLVICAGGCVIPPSLSVDNQDAGVNSPPAILAVRSNDSGELPEPGPVLFDVGQGTMTAELIDTDLDDTLFVRVFVDYTIDHPTAPRVTCTAAANQKPERPITCDTQALCLMEDVGQTRNMTVVVFDRPPQDTGDPPFQSMPTGGLSTSRFYFLNCAEPPQ